LALRNRGCDSNALQSPSPCHRPTYSYRWRQNLMETARMLRSRVTVCPPLPQTEEYLMDPGHWRNG
jgi:hypothetical protein